ncbi:MAG TPA: nuclear transport factor 2 family protein [Acidimicrobiia bacterium]|nr:nuclear transport factor 2 family protein [Acidimicrobiia bacterium]
MEDFAASLERARRFGESMRQAANAHDIDAVMALLTDDVFWSTSASPEAVQGKQDVLAWISSFFVTFPDVRFDLIGGPYVAADSRQAVYLWQVTGTMLGPGPDGLTPTGELVEYEEIDIVTFDGDQAVRVTVHVDMLRLGQQIGLVPHSA